MASSRNLSSPNACHTVAGEEDSYVLPVKSKVKILQNFVAFSEYVNFNKTFKKQINQKVQPNGFK